MRAIGLTSFFAVCLAIGGCTTTPAADDTGTDSGGGGIDAGRDGGSAGNDSGGSGNDAGGDAASGDDAAVTDDAGDDAGMDAATTSDAGTDAGSDAGHDAAVVPPDTGCTGVLLTIIDSFAWCDVTVNGGTAFGGATETVCVPASSDVTLVHTAHTGFILGKWFGTDGDTGTGEAGDVSGSMSTAHLTTGAAGTSACVSLCCPFTGGTGCPTTDVCP